MHKVGILTFHDVLNPGAFLQAYATQQLLNEQGVPNEIIDYRTRSQIFKSWKTYFIQKNPIKIVVNLFQLICFRRARRAHVKLSKRCYSADDINRLGLSVIIIGSDEVWNLDNQLYHDDHIYLGAGLSAEIIAFSVSVGAIEQGIKVGAVFKNHVKKYKAVSARDQKTKQIACASYPNVISTIDPTLLCNFSGATTAPHGRRNRYLLVYINKLSKQSVISLQKYAKANSLKIISVFYWNCWANENVLRFDPIRFARLFANAEVVVTHAFHGVMFAVKYSKQFVHIQNIAKASKIDDFLLKVGIRERSCSINDREKLEEILYSEIDYKCVQYKISKLREVTADFLKHNVNCDVAKAN